MDKAGPIGLDDSCERLGNTGAVEKLQACVVRPARQLLFVNKPAMPIPKRAHAYVGPDPQKHPIDRVVGKRKACARAGKENISAKSHYASELAEARARISNVLDHFETACDVKGRTIKRQIIGISNKIPDIRRIGVERARMQNVVLIDVEGNKVLRVLAQVAVNVAFAATDIDQTRCLGCA